ncbi:MAG: ribonuclease R [Patescibacteria group bacterium]
MIKKYIEGFITTTGRGTGFVSQGEDELRENDIRIEAGFLKTALPNDRVKVLLYPKILGAKQQTGEVVEILERIKKTFVGTIKENGVVFVIPQNTNIYVNFFIPNPPKGKVLNGKKVFIRFISWDDPKKPPQAEIIEIIGNAGENETEIRAIVLEGGLSLEIPADIENEATMLKKNASAFIVEEAKKRRDFRDVITFTIDPADAKDFDDAISIKTLQNGDFEIGVHIADVSAYVKAHTAIDEEARRRATSIYLVDRVIPMFPEILSNDLCSLNQGDDKLVFSAVFIFAKESAVNSNEKAIIKESWFGRAIINSNKRFTYEEAQEVLNKHSGIFYNELNILNIIAKKLIRQNKEEGAISFEQEEVRFILDENKKPIRVYKKISQDTNKLIEGFMLLANKKVAEFVSSKMTNNKSSGKKGSEDIFIYRIHDEPKPKRLLELAHLLSGLGHKIHLEDGRVSSHDINKLLEKIKGTPEEAMLNIAIIRTMAKAIYSTENRGHYGVAFEHYTHFTSPIRRYPDVMVHRLLEHYLAGEPVSKEEMKEYRLLSIHSSEMEKLAADAERASVKYKQAEYMSVRVGQEFNGMISGVVEWGIFVEEDETKCEGLVRISDLGKDFYIFEKEKYRIIGKNSRKRYTLGDKVRIRVKSVDIGRKSIDYELI